MAIKHSLGEQAPEYVLPVRGTALGGRYPGSPKSRHTTNNTTQQTSLKRFIGREKFKRVDASAWARCSRELRRQGLYKISEERGFPG